MSDAPYQDKAHLATIIAAIVAIVALAFGFFQFRKTQQVTQETLKLQQEMLAHDREIKAIELFIRFNEIQQRPTQKLRSRGSDADFWRRNILLTMTESVFRLTKGDEAWRATVVFMVQTQAVPIADFQLDCKTLDYDFVKLVREVVHKEVCA